MKYQYQNRLTETVYYITTTVVDWIDIFTRPQYKYVIIDSLQYCQQQKGLILYGWVLMTNHIHLLVGCDEKTQITDIMRDFKRFTSRRILEIIENERQESRRLWLIAHFKDAARGNKKNQNYKLWQTGMDIQEIFLPDYFYEKLTYIHLNPVRAEITEKAEEYLYSSARDYAGDKGLLDVMIV
ncbi:MAG: transposase [Tannerellaceae bacterium]|nr:transposase [Tannerellaceae bacterium]